MKDGVPLEIRRHLENDRLAKSLGIELQELREGYARCAMVVTEDMLNAHGSAHGGAIFTLADFAFAAACNSHGTVAVGLDTSMSFVRGPSAGVLTAEALEESRSRRVSVVNVRVTDAQGDLVAVFRGTAFRKDETIDAGKVKPSEDNAALRILRARHRIAVLSDYNRLRASDRRTQEITELGLRYNLLTAYTSFVAIDSEVRNKEGKPSTVKQPLPPNTPMVLMKANPPAAPMPAWPWAWRPLARHSVGSAPRRC